MHVNNVVVVGNLTSDPRISDGENKVANFRIAVNRWRRPDPDKPDEQKERTEFIDVECWGTQAENVQATLRRGDRAIVAGQIRYEQWNDDEGNPKSRIRIRALAVGPSLEFQTIGS